jgi:hypothetical protein
MAVGACGGGDGPTVSTTPPPVTKAVINVLIDPNPVTAEATGNPQFPWDFRFNLQVSDSGGVGFIVTSMQTTVTSALSGLPLMNTGQNPFVGVKVPAFGQETRQFHVGAYRMENFTKEGKVNVKMNFVDDKGNASVYDGTVNVQHLGQPVRVLP